MHDFVTHGLGAVMLQAGGALRLLAVDPGKIDETMATLALIESRSGAALQEMRSLLDVLRGEDDGADLQPGRSLHRSPIGEQGDLPPGADQAASRTGPPGPLAGVGNLVSEARDLGLQIELQVEGDLDSLPRVVSMSAFRIVQESLNNALRHALGSSVVVVVRREGTELTVEVTDDGAPARDPAADRRLSGPEAAGRRSGYGLVGMQERAAVVSGDLAVGPVEGGGWQVRARLPVPTP